MGEVYKVRDTDFDRELALKLSKRGGDEGDPALVRFVGEGRLIGQLQHELNVTSVVVSHDVRGSFKVADRIALLHHGKIRKIGTAAEFVYAKDEVVREFLERDFQVLEAEH